MRTLGFRTPKVCLLIFLFFSSRLLYAQDVVLSGTVVTPNRVIDKGWVVVENGHIRSILEKAPDNAKGPRIETNGIIYPGFVDLHDHPMYNIFKRWTPKVKFRNRYEWRNLVDYYKTVGRPGSELQLKNDNDKEDQKFCDIDEFVEVKALIGGTTSISGISGRRQPPPVFRGWHATSTGRRDSTVRALEMNESKTLSESRRAILRERRYREFLVSLQTTRSICF